MSSEVFIWIISTPSGMAVGVNDGRGVLVTVVVSVDVFVRVGVSVAVGSVVGLGVVVASGFFVDVCSGVAVAVLDDAVVGLLHALRNRIAKPIIIVSKVGFLQFIFSLTGLAP